MAAEITINRYKTYVLLDLHQQKIYLHYMYYVHMVPQTKTSSYNLHFLIIMTLSSTDALCFSLDVLGCNRCFLVFYISNGAFPPTQL